MSKTGDAMIDKMNEGPLDPKRPTHIERLEEIHHDISVLVEEARCITMTELSEPHNAETLEFLFDMEAIARVWQRAFRS